MTHSESETTDWPDIDELKQLLDITGSDWDVTMTRQMAAAIAQVKVDVGRWDELNDRPDESLAKAALRLAVLMRDNAEAPTLTAFGTSAPSLTMDPIYQKCIKGHRRRLPIA